jgi:RHS repeat-associated protein
MRGPNSKSCGASCTVKDGWIATYDGGGRERTRSVMVDDPVLGYRAEQVSRTSYTDVPSPRMKVTREQKLDLGATPGRWAKTETELDGAGRTVIERSFDGATARAETRTFHDARGLVTRVESPQPGGANLTSVTWQYEYDDLGRKIAMREPNRDGCTGPLTFTAPLGWCGKRWSYDGRAATAEDVTGTGGGQIGRTRESYDAMGRLAKSELWTGTAWATTTFAFDARDHIVSTTSADSVVTTFTHDGLGRRTSVLRGANLWQLGYDLDGDLTSLTSPVPAAATTADYTSTFTYDLLGRELTRTPAIRDWSGPDVALFGGAVTRTYDTATNGVGRLATVSQSWGDVAYQYEARGLVTAEQHHIAIPGTAVNDTRVLGWTYNAAGAVLTSTAGDSANAALRTVFENVYDGRGALVTQKWLGHDTVQDAVRGADRRLVTRTTYAGGLPRGLSSTEYDGAGRIRRYEVDSLLPGAGGMSERALEAYRRDGAGDIFQIDHRITGAASPDPTSLASYGYDPMHRLISASDELGYTGAFAYSPGGRILAADVDADPAAVRVHRRDVNYTYAANVPGSLADPDAPVALPNDGQPGDFVTLAYDRAGNATGRNTQDGSYKHRYDGFDRQRRVQNLDESAEHSYYGPEGLREVTVQLHPGGAVREVVWNFGDTEIRYDGAGAVTRSSASTFLDDGAARVVDRTSLEWAFQEARGHTLAVIAENGSLSSAFSYGPYGEMLRSIGSATADQHERFNGKTFDDASGLASYGYRYFDDRTLTWTQADPAFTFLTRRYAGETLFSFSAGDPVNLIDDVGLQPRPIEPPSLPDSAEWIILLDTCDAKCQREAKRQEEEEKKKRDEEERQRKQRELERDPEYRAWLNSRKKRVHDAMIRAGASGKSPTAPGSRDAQVEPAKLDMPVPLVDELNPVEPGARVPYVVILARPRHASFESSNWDDIFRDAAEFATVESARGPLPREIYWSAW